MPEVNLTWQNPSAENTKGSSVVALPVRQYYLGLTGCKQIHLLEGKCSFTVLFQSESKLGLGLDYNMDWMFWFIVIYRDRPSWKHDGQGEESQIDLY